MITMGHKLQHCYWCITTSRLWQALYICVDSCCQWYRWKGDGRDLIKIFIPLVILFVQSKWPQTQIKVKTFDLNHENCTLHTILWTISLQENSLNGFHPSHYCSFTVEVTDMNISTWKNKEINILNMSCNIFYPLLLMYYNK
jgi:hypothetical protein